MKHMDGKGSSGEPAKGGKASEEEDEMNEVA